MCFARCRLALVVLWLFVVVMPWAVQAQVPRQLQRWLETSQAWTRDTAGPVVSLGDAGSFDDTHIFAPAVAFNNGAYRLWYCGSTGAVANRVFQLGLATSSDGKIFQKHADNPVFEFGDGKHSILTPTVIHENDGLRMWFSSTWFEGGTGKHTLHETFSKDGMAWSKPSAPLLKNAYAPSVIKTGENYRMWFVDVGQDQWVIRHAFSLDGRDWRVTKDSCLVVDQEWESKNLFYPTVIKIDDVYLMWYGSYWASRPNTTALGFAASIDGLKWYKHSENPVLRPDPLREWESNYVTSQSVRKLADGSLRMWYASRKKPPFTNKYFAINTAIWSPEGQHHGGDSVESDSSLNFKLESLRRWQTKTRTEIRSILGIPKDRVALDAEKRGEFEWDGIVVEKWIFTSEPGSRVPAVLYRPKHAPKKPMPAIVLTFGHGGSKSQWQYNYAGQVYARMGVACLALDPIGEEERHRDGKLGTRAHDPKSISDRADKAQRLIMGKLVFDSMRGIDFLIERDDVDPKRIGVAGNSLGGAVASWMAAVDPRIKMAIVSGWAYDDIVLRSKYCTKLPTQRMRERLTWTEYAALAAPHCAVFVANGDADWIIDRDDDGTAWLGTREVAEAVGKVYERFGADTQFRAWFEPGGGHRPYFFYKQSLEWIHRHLGTPDMTLKQIRALPTLNSGQWCDQHNVSLEKLYGTPLHQRGATLPDFDVRPIRQVMLECLKQEERGSPEFTIEGWLQRIEREQD